MSSKTQTSGKGNEALVAKELFDLSGLKAVVTGGGTGIGLMITQALVANGVTVYITARRKEVLDTVVEKYSHGPGKIIAASCDITYKNDVMRLAKEIEKMEPNGIHILVNNAGIARERGTTAFQTGEPNMKDANSISEHLLKATPESWAETFDTNVTAQYFVSAAFLPLLSKGTANTSGYSSSIINVASISGMSRASSSGQYAYAASKAAFLHLSKMLGTTLSQCKVRVNTICPGIFPSEMTTDTSDETNKSFLEDKGRDLPAGRSGDEGDMASAVLYLVGKNSLFTNGQVLYPDGGALLTSPAAF
ncbi:hypothetical protein JAAARDRAFT_61240 [Jaapia argillacea MUCL 33604]|uniref:Uncharacterized protein n=1 Tax=Jaapia argillacea MUCL 33604 TaxID=933084 RepID=A0A067PI68_9AGAM|nr:hypothetical protein JAAARDRAFT_61240 [Jaapia argillacea MUCL 33604]